MSDEKGPSAKLTSPLDIRGDLNNAAIAAKFEPRKPRFSLFDILVRQDKPDFSINLKRS